MILKPISTYATAAAVASLALTVPITTAHAGEKASPEATGITTSGQIAEKNIEAAYREMIAGGVEHDRHIEDGKPVVTFQLTEGTQWTLPDFDAPQPYVSGGREEGGFYLTFTPWEQDLIIGGTGAALTSLICAVPGVGPIACGIATILVVAAGATMGNSKPCGNNHYRVSYSWVGTVRGTRCA